MANSRYYSSIALQTTLNGNISNSATSMTVASTTGFPGSLPYTLSVDYGAASEELVEVTAVGGLTLTITRAIDGTSATSHNSGAVVRHVSSARDFTDSRTHEAATTGVHGVSGTIVDTTSAQTLSNKTLTLATGTLKNIDIYNTGAASITSIIGDSLNQTVNRFEILDNEANLVVMAAFTSNGTLFLRRQSADVDASYRIRSTDTNGSTDRFALLAGGTMTITPNGTTTSVPIDIIAPDTTNTKRTIRVAAAGGGTERFTVWNDGKVDIVGTDTTQSILDIKGPASHAAAYFRVLDSALNTVATVSSAGKIVGNWNIDARADNSAGSVPLRVFANNPGPQTADLQQWVNSSNVIAGSVDADGDFTVKSLTTAGNVTSSATVSGLVVNGGTGTFGNLQSGTATTPAPGGGGGTSTVNIIFPIAFGSTPNVVITPNSNIDFSANSLEFAITTKSTTGFTIQCYRTSNFSTNFEWIAHK